MIALADIIISIEEVTSLLDTPTITPNPKTITIDILNPKTATIDTATTTVIYDIYTDPASALYAKRKAIDRGSTLKTNRMPKRLDSQPQIQPNSTLTPVDIINTLSNILLISKEEIQTIKTLSEALKPSLLKTIKITPLLTPI